MIDMTITGYHCTTMKSAESILSSGFRPSTKPTEWLGTGVYFFENLALAKMWTPPKSADKTVPIDKVILISTLSCGVGGAALFDLDVEENMQKLQDEFNRAIPDLDGIPNFKDDQGRQQGDIKRCFVCNFYRQKHPEIKVLSFTFPTTQYNQLGFSFQKKNKQIVAMPEVISNTKLLKEDEDYAI